MNEIVIEITVGIGLSILIILMITHVIIFNKYKKIKMNEKPDFNASQYQVKAGSTYFIFPIYINEKDTNSELIRLKNIYNKSIKIWWIAMVTFLLVIFILIIIKKLLSNS